MIEMQSSPPPGSTSPLHSTLCARLGGRSDLVDSDQCGAPRNNEDAARLRPVRRIRRGRGSSRGRSGTAVILAAAVVALVFLDERVGFAMPSWPTDALSVVLAAALVALIALIIYVFTWEP